MSLYRPTATYRLQMHAGFTFADAAAQVPYLAALGPRDNGKALTCPGH